MASAWSSYETWLLTWTTSGIGITGAAVAACCRTSARRGRAQRQRRSGAAAGDLRALARWKTRRRDYRAAGGITRGRKDAEGQCPVPIFLCNRGKQEQPSLRGVRLAFKRNCARKPHLPCEGNENARNHLQALIGHAAGLSCLGDAMATRASQDACNLVVDPQFLDGRGILIPLSVLPRPTCPWPRLGAFLGDDPRMSRPSATGVLASARARRVVELEARLRKATEAPPPLLPVRKRSVPIAAATDR
jgi:hypothetical protein